MKLNTSIKIKVLKQAIIMLNNMKRNASKDDIPPVKAKLFAMNKGPLKEVWHKVNDLWAVIKSRDFPFSEKVLPLAALIYAVTPMDAIPDIVPFLGLSDDATVIVATAATIASTIIKNKEKSKSTVESK